MECGGCIAVAYEDTAFSLQLFRRKEIWLRCVLAFPWKAVPQETVDALSLAFQRDNQQSASAIGPANGNIGEKGRIFHHAVGMGQAYPIWQGQNKRLCHSMWLLHLHNTMKMQTFSQDFPFGGIHSQGILLVIPLKLQGKKHQPFSRTQPNKTATVCCAWLSFESFSFRKCGRRRRFMGGILGKALRCGRSFPPEWLALGWI